MNKASLTELLLHDLRKIHFPKDYPFFIPENIFERHRETLKGPYIVQIVTTQDVNSSLHQQTEKLEQENPSSETKHPPSRMLKFILHDGHQTCLAFEHLSLSELNSQSSLSLIGTKVKLEKSSSQLLSRSHLFPSSFTHK
jgi:hypothetical protein